MNVQNLKLQFSNPDVRSSNVAKTQIPVARFSLNNRNSSDSLLNGNPAPNQSFLHSNSNSTLFNSVKSPTFNSSPSLNNSTKSPTFNSTNSFKSSLYNSTPTQLYSQNSQSYSVKSPTFNASPSQFSTPDKSVKSFTFNSSPNQYNHSVKSPNLISTQSNSQNNFVKSPTLNSSQLNSQNNFVKSPTLNSSQLINSQNNFVKSPISNSTSSNFNTQNSTKAPTFTSSNSLKATISNNQFSQNVSQNIQTSSSQRPSSPDRWKSKYEDAERKRKTLLTQNQKLNREHEDLQRKYNLAQREVDSTKKELIDRETQLNQLRKLSEAVYKEYDQLKDQYEMETGTMQKAMQKASQWYKQNRELKRRSSVLMQRVIQFDPQAVPELADDTDSGVSTDNDEFEDLRKTVQDLNRDVARLQAEVNAAKLQEFEAQETIVDLSSQLEEERNARELLESELKELRSLRENFGQVSRLVAAEVSSLREQCEKEKENAQRMKEDADKANKERNVMAHQSQLLMFDVAADERLIQLLMEVEVLKRSLEEEKQRHATEIQVLQENLEDREEPHVELLEEKLKLAEGELQCAIERAERAENFSKQLITKVSKLEEDLEKSQVAPPPPPPLPPPPPPLPLLSQPAPVTLRRRPNCDGAESNSIQNHTSSAVLEMANLLGIPPRKTSTTPAIPGAIDDIINQIKGGRFTLKSTEPKPRLSKVDEQPPVVQEMINVLGTLRKRRTPSMRRKQENPHPDLTL